jgi:hypothetical protein
MAATVKHLKQLEKIFLGIRENADEKLAQLNSEFIDHQEWLKKAVVDTKESKYVPSTLPRAAVTSPVASQQRVVFCEEPRACWPCLDHWLCFRARAHRLPGRTVPWHDGVGQASICLL